jgi:hypothetical protein
MALSDAGGRSRVVPATQTGRHLVDRLDGRQYIGHRRVVGRQRRYYDPFHRKLAEEGPAEQIRTLISPYASRLGNNDQFNPAEPNCAVKIQVRSGGFTEGFQSGSEWQSRWTASGTWQTVAGTLTHPSGANATLAPVAEVFNPNFALYVEVTSPAPITDTLGVALSGNNSLAWQPSTQQWVCTIAGQNLTRLAHPTRLC